MNKIEAKLQDDFFNINSFDKFNIEIDNALIELWSEKSILYVEIHSSNKDFEETLFKLLSIIFLCLGFFPKILSILINGKEFDTTKLVSRFNTSQYFKRKDLSVCKINEDSLNSEIYNNFFNLNIIPINSLQYLVSESYEKVNIVHKITLLFHVIDGVVLNNTDNILNKTKNEMRIIYKTQNVKIGTYEAKVYYLCKNYFFNYDDEYNCEILSLLEISQYKFIQTISDTRHWYSHFLDENKKENRLNQEKKPWVYFQLMIYVIRLFLIDKIGIVLDKNLIKEYLYTIHDWISDINGKDALFKSIAYKSIKGLEEMRNIINAHNNINK